MKTMTTILLATGAAFFYMAASWMMKEWGAQSLLVLVPIVLVTLSLGVFFEIEVLKTARLGHVIVLVLAIELVMTFVVATTLLGEVYSRREALAVVVIATGILLLSWRGETPDPALAKGHSLDATSSDQALRSASTPGSGLPSIHSRNAPPAVET